MKSAFKVVFSQMQSKYREQLRLRDQFLRVREALRSAFLKHSADDGVTPALLSDISTMVCAACPELSGPGAVVVTFEPEVADIVVTFPNGTVTRAVIRSADCEGEGTNYEDDFHDSVMASIKRMLGYVLGRQTPPPYDRRSPPSEG